VKGVSGQHQEAAHKGFGGKDAVDAPPGNAPGAHDQGADQHPYAADRFDISQPLGGGQVQKHGGEQDEGKVHEEILRDLGYHVSDIEAGLSTLETASESLAILTNFLLIMALLTAIVGSIGLTGTMGMNVMERTREIGVMRAIGATDGQIMRTVMVEGMIIEPPDVRDTYVYIRVAVDKIRLAYDSTFLFRDVHGNLLAQVMPGETWRYGDQRRAGRGAGHQPRTPADSRRSSRPPKENETKKYWINLVAALFYLILTIRQD
jgi:hypothetical protein